MSGRFENYYRFFFHAGVENMITFADATDSTMKHTFDLFCVIKS